MTDQTVHPQPAAHCRAECQDLCHPQVCHHPSDEEGSEDAEQCVGQHQRVWALQVEGEGPRHDVAELDSGKLAAAAK